MRSLKLLVISLFLGTNPIFSKTLPKNNIIEQSSDTEIHPNKLPANARMFIMENYAGCEILKAYKLNPEKASYKVVILVNENEKTLFFSKEGKWIKD